MFCYSFFFFNDTATTEIYTLSLHDALPIYGASGGETKDGGLVGRARSLARDDVPERDAVVVRADFERAGGPGLGMRHRHSCAIAVVDSGGMGAVPGVSFVLLVGLRAAGLGALGEVHAIHDDAERRGRDHGLRMERYRVLQPSIRLREQELHVSVGAGDGYLVRRPHGDGEAQSHEENGKKTQAQMK